MAAFDSSIRLRQINQGEISGYILQIIQGYLSNSGSPIAPTGNLTGSFYPLLQNPSGYEISGAFATQEDIDSSATQTLSYVANNYYPDTNPNGYISQGSNLTFSLQFNCTSGVQSDYVAFPFAFTGGPKVSCIFVNNVDTNEYYVNASNISNTGFQVTYSNFLTKTGYLLDILINGYPAVLQPYNSPTSFIANCTSGAQSQFITYPSGLTYTPKVTCVFVNNIDSNNYYLTLSGVNNSGFYVNYSNVLGASGYQLDVMFLQ